VEEPVDATGVPPDLKGFRTMFTTLHHFRPEMVSRILQDAVNQRCSIGIFDLSARTPPPISMVLWCNPIGALLATPFVRPFRWTRLLWTYIIPIVPIFSAWDGFVSGPRLYSVQELQEIVQGLPSNDYVWELGREPFPRYITYLIGYPALQKK
jgi:hypothetical protein